MRKVHQALLDEKKLELYPVEKHQKKRAIGCGEFSQEEIDLAVKQNSSISILQDQ
jgi:hypothetical protein